ncbi:MAG: PfkB family carbohydrate kinase [Candidatus Micrarchaeia archaeon]
MTILCTGSIALDTTRTPFKTVERVLGGSVSYFATAANFFHPIAIVSAVGNDFPKEHWQFLENQGINLSCVKRVDGEKTLFFDSSFGYDFHARKANKLELNVFENFQPSISQELAKSEYVFLATLLPQVQLDILKNTPKKKFSFMDTIEYYIQTDKKGVEKVLGEVDGAILNDVEARMLCNTPNLIKAGKKILDHGMKIVILKKGEHGCLVFTKDQILPFPAFPLEEIRDPTGAGDCFAGGFMGQIAKGGGKTDNHSLKKAVAYANVMGSFVVEDFGLNRLEKIKNGDIEKRFEQYKEMVSLP